MPPIDQCEPQIIRALEKGGWKIQDKTYSIEFSKKRYIYADLSLIKDSQQIIVVEIKCFTNPNTALDDFYGAIGQCLFYRNALKLKMLNYPLYLAVPLTAYMDVFQLPAAQLTVEDAKINLIVVDMLQEEIVRWLD